MPESGISAYKTSFLYADNSAWNGLKTGVMTTVNALKTGVTTAWNGLKSSVSTTMTSLKTTVVFCKLVLQKRLHPESLLQRTDLLTN